VIRLASRAKAALLAASLGACGGASTFLTSPDEYAAYRATRVEPTLEARLSAASAYLARYPGGAFAHEVRAWLRRVEPVYYDAKRGSAAGLAAYLRVLPAGAFAREAALRLGELRRAREVADVAPAAETASRIDAEQEQRRRVREEIAAWVGRFLDPAAWRGPLSEAPAEVLVPYSVALPPPSCRLLEDDEMAAITAETEGVGPGAGGAAGAAALPAGSFRCAKVLGLPYTVKVEGGSEPREATLEVAVIQDPAGRPRAVMIGGPDLFLRLEEARAVRALAADDAAARIGGISIAVELAGAAFRARVSADPACRRQPVAPVVLDLSCGGLELAVRAAVAPGGDDVIAIAPAR
jgi:hypothetical protein